MCNHSNHNRRPPATAILLLVILGLAQHIIAEDSQPKSDAKPPRIALSLPLGIPQSGTTKVTLRGWLLKDASEVNADHEGVKVSILGHSAAAIPGRQKAEEIGDEQLNLEVTLPEKFDGDAVHLTVVSPDGTSTPHTVLVDRDDTVIDEVEPNDGFRQAQQIELPQSVQGSIHSDGNVDVFTFTLAQETPVQLAVIAVSLGSNCDSLLTVTSASGTIIASCDDRGPSRDAVIEIVLPAGQYFLTLQDAHDRGGPAHPYRLTVAVQKQP